MLVITIMTSTGTFRVTSNKHAVGGMCILLMQTMNTHRSLNTCTACIWNVWKNIKGEFFTWTRGGGGSVTSTHVRKWVLFEFKWKISIEILLTADKIHLQYKFQILQLLCSYCLPNHNSQQMPKMSYIWINARTDMSVNGRWQPVPARLRILWQVSQMHWWRVFVIFNWNWIHLSF